MIGIYAHHHGAGHIQRCRQIQRQLAELGEDSAILSTAPGADVVLADDAMDEHLRPHGRAMTAGASLHYAPYGNPGLRQRLAEIAAWVERYNPKAFYVDVSVEVGAFVRLMGVPVITLAMPGLRDDAPHQLAYTQADAIIAAWPGWVPLPEHLRPHADRVHAVGGISRLERAPGAGPGGGRDPRHVVVMAGRGGSTWEPEDFDAVENACAGYRFTFLTGDSRIEDPGELSALLSRAGVAVIAGGQNSVADIAVAGAPAVVLPQPRPFIEQKATARELARAGLAVVAESFPSPAQWPELLERAGRLRPDWSRWETAGAAQRAARVISEVAGGARPDSIALVSLADSSRAAHLTHQVNLKPEGTDHVTVALADAPVLRKAVPKSHVVSGTRNLAAARNLGARTAIERGADVLVFLDADCVCSGELVEYYCRALANHPDAVVAGPVTYMAPGELRTVKPDPHPARPNPAPGEVIAAQEYNLFWSLSFGMRAQTWERIERDFGGFDTGYTGYGGEDTDFARNLAAHGIALYWVGGAHAFHQHHPVSSPPWEHLDDIVNNAEYFRSKWGTYPMEGWLEAFAEAGAIERVDGSWRRTGEARA
ncbi:glycosyltransferase [Corynebacterium liangguodongii]|uniref:Glycosyltransferase 2-like domain-containing protein n=1 Tax=Corynebacterium liangguodongii TaxID=2079535 RepID=A0A2S0WFH8_9CORY|nr:glycosyltransferase [Corynebacterium liangguodongii]AWB84537.1 hypothetical protein C3E79_08605 [Corynebacterium liangguodongii]PWB98879.1 hypothetical protein DF219_09780 [Corynebacterium liangguodongii]